MTAAILIAFAPVFAMILVGYGVRVTGWLPTEVWPGVNRLNYRLLLPCFVFAAIARADLGDPDLLGLAAVSILLSLTLAGLAFAVARALHLQASVTAPVVAVATLWNLVMFMALSARLLGPDIYAASVVIMSAGTATGAAVAVASFALAQPESQSLGLKRLALDPLVIGTVSALAFNLTGLTRITLFTETITLMGAGATAAILISMGAGLEFDKLKGRLAPLSLAAGLRALVSPALFMGAGLLLGLPAEHVVLLTLAGGAPGAAVVYAIGTEFDGDRPLSAGMLTASVPLSALALPVFTALAIALTGLGV